MKIFILQHLGEYRHKKHIHAIDIKLRLGDFFHILYLLFGKVEPAHNELEKVRQCYANHM